MKTFLGLFGLRFTTGHALWAATLIPACIAVFMHLGRLWIGVTLAVIIALAAVLTVRGRRLTGWIGRCSRGVGDIARRPTCRRCRRSVRR